METASLIVAAALFLAIGLGLGLLFSRHAGAAAGLAAERSLGADLAAARQRLAVAEAALAEARARAASSDERARADRDRIERLGASLAAAEAQVAAERAAAAERAREAERTREQVRAEVEKLAGRVLDAKGEALLGQNKAGLEALLAPVREKLEEFRARVESVSLQDNRDRAALLESMRKLDLAQARLHDDAAALARALTGDSKAQGDWGELVLERLLESAGLTAGREYDLQVSRTDEDGGRKRPDAVVYLPGDRAIVVDAKCSLTAFVEATRAPDEGGRDAALDAHVASLRAHVKELVGKSYQDVLAQRTLDLVFMFVPTEAAFHAALSRDPALCEDAFRQGIGVVSPTTLLPTLRLVAHVWRSERQGANARRIAQDAGKLLDKLAAFVADVDDVGARLGQAQRSFDAARAKLVSGRGNVLKRARDLAALGAQAKPATVEALAHEAGEDDGDEAMQAGLRPALAEATSLAKS
ncbi:MAG: DNA recombination protein RmuC [Anaeromyxobacteraceae bacterium]